MKAGTVLVLAAAFLAFNYEARAGTIIEETFACRITEQARQAVENYVIKKYDSVSCQDEWMKIDVGVRKKCLRVDTANQIREFYIEIFCSYEYRICTEIFLIMEKEDWRNLINQPP